MLFVYEQCCRVAGFVSFDPYPMSAETFREHVCYFLPGRNLYCFVFVPSRLMIKINFNCYGHILVGRQFESLFIVTRHKIKEMNRKSIRILLAEDNEINRKLIVKLLSNRGFIIESVPNGNKAYEAVLNGEFDLVLMDVQMPEMDGFETTKAIRNTEPAGKHIPIIAMTAHALQGDRERCLEAGMDDYVSKPINPDILFEMLEKWSAKPVKNDEKRKMNDQNNIELASPIDVAMALPLFANDMDFYIEMLDEFVNRLPQIHLEMQQTFRNNDLQKLAHLGHNLKGLSSNFQAKNLTELSQKIEENSSKGDLDTIAEILNEISAEIQRVTNFFKTLSR